MSMSSLPDLFCLLERRPRQMVQMILENGDQVRLRYSGRALQALSIKELLALQE